VTAGLSPNNIGFVMPQAAMTLTKRRAVDFCHVATAICPRPAALIPGPRGADLLNFLGAGEGEGAAAADDK
jgi:hypothetical protein